jgi:hypothetical protein
MCSVVGKLSDMQVLCVKDQPRAQRVCGACGGRQRTDGVRDDDIRWLSAHCLLECARPPRERVLGEPQGINSSVVCDAGERPTTAVSGPANPTAHTFARRRNRGKAPAATSRESSITRAKVRTRI